MSSTRNKRKRPENDSIQNNNSAPTSRRRSRESRGNQTSTAGPKNEEASHASKAKSRLDSNTSDKTSAANKDAPASVGPELTKSNAKEDKSGPSQENASSNLPLHLREEANSQHFESPIAAPPDHDGSRRSGRIKKLIEHRALLVSRLRLCKGAAEQRIREASIPQQNQVQNGTAGKEITDDEEIQNHREIARIASAFARKAREGENITEKRTSLSLRRGSSVGKRMNAALSTLAPGMASTNTADQASTLQQAATPRGEATVASLRTQSPAVGPQYTSSASTIQLSTASKAQRVAASQTSKQTTAMPNGGEFERKYTQIKGPKGPGGASPATVSGHKPEVLSMSARPQILPQHQHRSQRHVSLPKVVFPEARRLRDRKHLIHANLQSLQRHHVSSQTPHGYHRLPFGRSSHATSSELAIYEEQAAELPKRRKTHWDRLLREMKWLASDFIEERKWKNACARTLSTAIPVAIAKKGNGNRKANSAPSDSNVDAKNNGKKITGGPPSKLSTSPIDRFSSTVDAKYIHPSDEDQDAARKKGRQASNFITKLTECKSYVSSSNHSNGLSGFDNRSVLGLASTASRTSEESSTEGILPRSTDEITKYMDRIEEIKPQNGSWTGISYGKGTKPIRLTKSQKNGLNFVEARWNASSPVGVLLEGNDAVGKTVAVCALLATKRKEGPHLLICPQNNLMRWRIEISRFQGLHPITFLPLQGAEQDSIGGEWTSPEAGDVVLCQMSLVDELLSVMNVQGIKFHSMVVDTRGDTSKNPSTTLKTSQQNPVKKGDCGEHRPTSFSIWSSITKVACFIPRRILVGKTEKRSSLISSLEIRQRLEALSMRTAYLIGPKAFSDPQLSLTRMVIQWARQREKRPGEGKFDRVFRVLTDYVQKVSVDISHRVEEPSIIVEETRFCEMGRNQRLSYDKSCSQVRGALSMSLDVTSDDAMSNKAICEALVYLQLACFMSQDTHQRHQYGSNAEAWSSCSQPNFDTAVHLLQNSGKLMELACILVGECSVTFSNHDSVLEIMRESGKAVQRNEADRLSNGKEKVVIIGISPKARQMVSLLLGTLGVKHETLDRANCSGLAETAHTQRGWANSQRVLREFNETNGLLRYPQVLVVSPWALAELVGSIGIGAAARVVVLDEGWSGVTEGSLKDVLDRWKSSVALAGGGGTLMRLVSKGTIEENIFRAKTGPTEEEENDNRLSVQNLSKASGLSEHRSGLLVLRNVPLSEALFASAVSVRFVSGSSLLFLPSGKDVNVALMRQAERRLLTQLLVFEEMGEVVAERQPKYQSPIHGSSTVTTVGLPWTSPQLSRLSALLVFKQQQVLGFAQTTRTPALSDYAATATKTKRAITRAGEESESVTNLLVGMPSASDHAVMELLGYSTSHKISDDDADADGVSGSSSVSCHHGKVLRENSSIPLNLDGNQGSEMVTFSSFSFAPKVLPQVTEDRVQTFKALQPNVSGGERQTKRKDSDTPQLTRTQNVKRARVEDPLEVVDTLPDSNIENDSRPPTNDSATPSATEEKLETNNESSSNHRLPVDSSVLPHAGLDIHGSHAGALSHFEGFAEEYFTLCQESMDVRNLSHSATSSYGKGTETLQLIALFVKKTINGSDNLSLSHRHPTGALPTEPHVHQIPALDTGGIVDTRDLDNMKKAKKKASNQVASSAFNRIGLATSTQGNPGTVSLQLNNDETLKRKIFAAFSARSFGTGLSMFESTAFRFAASEVEGRVRGRLSQLPLVDKHIYETGSGLPLCLVRLLKANKKEGPVHSDTIGMPASRSSLRLSTVSPCRVDFGPFTCGFLAHPAGMTIAALPRSRLGASLPMGVKIPFNTRDRGFDWTDEDDKLLEETSERFGMNWIVVAKSMNSVGDKAAPAQRSARQCRDRWEALARDSPRVANAVRISERKLRQNSFQRREDLSNSFKGGPEAALHRSPSGLLQPVLNFSNEDDAATRESSENLLNQKHSDGLSKPDDKQKKVADTANKSMLSILAGASKRKQVIPIAIPGLPPGGKTPQIVASHHSHMQSVQSSVAAQWSNGRTEMWPLQILDCADKFYASRATASGQRKESNNPSSSSSTGRRHPAGVQRAAGNRAISSNRPPSHRVNAPPANARGKNTPDSTKAKRAGSSKAAD